MQLDSSNTIAGSGQAAVIATLTSGRLVLDRFDEFGPLRRGGLCEHASAPLALERLLSDQGRGRVGYVPSEDLL